MLLAQVMNPDSSYQDAVNDAAISRLVGGLTSCSTAIGGHCKARQRLPTYMDSKLAVRTDELLDDGVLCMHVPKPVTKYRSWFGLILNTTLNFS
jgi:hypothetical protein